MFPTNILAREISNFRRCRQTVSRRAAGGLSLLPALRARTTALIQTRDHPCQICIATTQTSTAGCRRPKQGREGIRGLPEWALAAFHTVLNTAAANHRNLTSHSPLPGVRTRHIRWGCLGLRTTPLILTSDSQSRQKHLNSKWRPCSEVVLCASRACQFYARVLNRSYVHRRKTPFQNPNPKKGNNGSPQVYQIVVAVINRASTNHLTRDFAGFCTKCLSPIYICRKNAPRAHLTRTTRTR